MGKLKLSFFIDNLEKLSEIINLVDKGFFLCFMLISLFLKKSIEKIISEYNLIIIIKYLRNKNRSLDIY